MRRLTLPLLLLGLFAACGSREKGEYCEGDAECEDGLVCIGDRHAACSLCTGVCDDPSGTGESCEEAGDCRSHSCDLVAGICLAH